MTTEQLLAPRYEVIALWPNTDWKVGDIIEHELSSSAIKLYDTYPHLFKRLQWYEKREASELLNLTHLKRRPGGILFSNLEDFYTGFKIQDGEWANFGEGHNIHLSHLLPATSEEYETYKSKQP